MYFYNVFCLGGLSTLFLGATPPRVLLLPSLSSPLPHHPCVPQTTGGVNKNGLPDQKIMVGGVVPRQAKTTKQTCCLGGEPTTYSLLLNRESGAPIKKITSKLYMLEGISSETDKK